MDRTDTIISAKLNTFSEFIDLLITLDTRTTVAQQQQQQTQFAQTTAQQQAQHKHKIANFVSTTIALDLALAQ